MATRHSKNLPAAAHGADFPKGESLKGSLLVAMPNLRADSFTKSVVYICTHGPAGAMGLVVNQAVPEVTFRDLLSQLHLPMPESEIKIEPTVHFGGPVEAGRGFVLHSTDFLREDTVRVGDGVGITGTVDILRAIAGGQGPRKSIFALGYAGWGPGQLEAEIYANSWLTVPADDDLLFGSGLAGKWERALQKIGATPLSLSLTAGHA